MRARSAGFALKTISQTPLFQLESQWYHISAAGAVCHGELLDAEQQPAALERNR